MASCAFKIELIIWGYNQPLESQKRHKNGMRIPYKNLRYVLAYFLAAEERARRQGARYAIEYLANGRVKCIADARYLTLRQHIEHKSLGYYAKQVWRGIRGAARILALLIGCGLLVASLMGVGILIYGAVISAPLGVGQWWLHLFTVSLIPFVIVSVVLWAVVLAKNPFSKRSGIVHEVVYREAIYSDKTVLREGRKYCTDRQSVEFQRRVQEAVGQYLSRLPEGVELVGAPAPQGVPAAAAAGGGAALPSAVMTSPASLSGTPSALAPLDPQAQGDERHSTLRGKGRLMQPNRLPPLPEGEDGEEEEEKDEGSGESPHPESKG